MKTQKVVAKTLAIVGSFMIVLGLVHTIVGLPLVLEATKNDTIGLPSIEDAGVGVHLFREPVMYGMLSVGVDRCIFGVILLICVPELKKGRRIAWRICVAIGSILLVGCTALVWTTFEHVHFLALVMPAIGLMILIPLLAGRHRFTVE